MPDQMPEFMFSPYERRQPSTVQRLEAALD